MKAIRIEKFGGPTVMKVQEVDLPSISDTEVLVKIKSAGVNPVDTYIREGQFSALPGLPFTPGKDGAGVVEKVGAKVTGLQKGQRVFLSMRLQSKYGTYAEYAVANEKEIFPLDDRLTFDQGAALGIPYFTAYRALFIKGKAQTGAKVLIHGASGAVGLACVQLAKSHQMVVIGTAGTPEGMKLVKDNGADHVLCHRSNDYLEAIMEITENEGVDIIVEMLSNVNLGKDIQLLAPHGKVMVVGCRGSVSINPRFMMGSETMIIGVALFNSTEKEMKETSSAILKGIKDGVVIPVIDKRYDLEHSSEAHHDVIKSKGAKGKLIIYLDV